MARPAGFPGQNIHGIVWWGPVVPSGSQTHKDILLINMGVGFLAPANGTTTPYSINTSINLFAVAWNKFGIIHFIVMVCPFFIIVFMNFKKITRPTKIKNIPLNEFACCPKLWRAQQDSNLRPAD